MLRQLLTFGLLIITITGFSQSKLTPKQISNRNYKEVIRHRPSSTDTITPDKYPMYPDGIKGINDHISRTMTYPLDALIRGVQGIVILSFIVEKDGTIKEIEVLQSIDPELDSEAIRVLKNLKIWEPGYKDGKPVKVKYQLAFNFNIGSPSIPMN